MKQINKRLRAHKRKYSRLRCRRRKRALGTSRWVWAWSHRSPRFTGSRPDNFFHQSMKRTRARKKIGHHRSCSHTDTFSASLDQTGLDQPDREPKYSQSPIRMRGQSTHPVEVSKTVTIQKVTIPISLRGATKELWASSKITLSRHLLSRGRTVRRPSKVAGVETRGARLVLEAGGIQMQVQWVWI